MIMDPRTNFLLQLLQKLGAPLMGAVNTHSQGDDTGQRDASIVATLLSESVKISISLSQAMNLRPDDGDADAIRVALAALAGGLISESYRQTGRLPGDNDARRLSKALESVIVFADNFAPSPEHTQRLQTLDGPPPFFDAVQTHIYAIHALLPAIAAIAEFSFGQSDTRLVQEVADQLGARAKELQQSMAATGGAVAELVILQALGQIYGSVHRAETKRLRDAGADQNASLDAVWAAFDKQTVMLDVLMASMSGGAAGSGRQGGGIKPTVAAAPEPPVSPEIPAAPPPASPPPASPPAGGSPMGFFKKK